eukprot:2027485-Rhodomonas_salina.2
MDDMKTDVSSSLLLPRVQGSAASSAASRVDSAATAATVTLTSAGVWHGVRGQASVFGLMALWVIMNLLLCTSLPSSIPDSYPADCILLALAHHGVVRCSSARAIHSQPRGSISVFTFAAEHGSL